ncbi:unnamed protein product [Gadus morhua 'NCC']
MLMTPGAVAPAGNMASKVEGPPHRGPSTFEAKFPAGAPAPGSPLGVFQAGEAGGGGGLEGEHLGVTGCLGPPEACLSARCVSEGQAIRRVNSGGRGPGSAGGVAQGQWGAWPRVSGGRGPGSTGGVAQVQYGGWPRVNGGRGPGSAWGVAQGQYGGWPRVSMGGGPGSVWGLAQAQYGGVAQGQRGGVAQVQHGGWPRVRLLSQQQEALPAPQGPALLPGAPSLLPGRSAVALKPAAPVES